MVDRVSLRLDLDEKVIPSSSVLDLTKYPTRESKASPQKSRGGNFPNLPMQRQSSNPFPGFNGPQQPYNPGGYEANVKPSFASTLNAPALNPRLAQQSSPTRQGNFTSDLGTLDRGGSLTAQGDFGGDLGTLDRGGSLTAQGDFGGDLGTLDRGGSLTAQFNANQDFGGLDRGAPSPFSTLGLAEGPQGSSQFLGTNPFAQASSDLSYATQNNLSLSPPTSEGNLAYATQNNLSINYGGGGLSLYGLNTYFDTALVTNTYDPQPDSTLIDPGQAVSNFTSWFRVSEDQTTYQLTGVVAGSWINQSGSVTNFHYSSGSTIRGPQLTVDPYDGQPTWYMSKSVWGTGPYIGEIMANNWTTAPTASFHVFMVASYEGTPIYPQFGGDTNNHYLLKANNYWGIGLLTATLNPGKTCAKFFWDGDTGTDQFLYIEFDQNALQLFEYWGDGTKTYARIGNGDVVSGPGGAGTWGLPTILRPQIDNSPTTHYVGYVSEVMTFDISQSAADATNLRNNYFYQKYPSTNRNPIA